MSHYNFHDEIFPFIFLFSLKFYFIEGWGEESAKAKVDMKGREMIGIKMHDV